MKIVLTPCIINFIYQALPDIRIKLAGILYLECLYLLGICVDVDGSGIDVGGVCLVEGGPDHAVVLLSVPAFICNDLILISLLLREKITRRS